MFSVSRLKFASFARGQCRCASYFLSFAILAAGRGLSGSGQVAARSYSSGASTAATASSIPAWASSCDVAAAAVVTPSAYCSAPCRVHLKSNRTSRQSS